MSNLALGSNLERRCIKMERKGKSSSKKKAEMFKDVFIQYDGPFFDQNKTYF
jgi:hypothetical protein